MAHAIRYAGRIEYASTWAEWPRCSWAETIRRAWNAAREDAARYGDIVAEVVSIDGRFLTAGENMSGRNA